MLRYNRARRAEWIEAQKKLEADALSAARIAYVKGSATDEQIALVEEASRTAEAQGVKLPPLLSPPEHRTHFEEHVQSVFTGAAASDDAKGVLGLFAGLFGGADKKASGAGAPPEPAAPESAVQSVEARASDAWAAEKERQRRGGSLDQLGLDAAGPAPPSPDKRRWWPW